MNDVLLHFDGDVEGVKSPRSHDFLIGHNDASTQLIHAFESSRFPQSWLITGGMGIGKATFAWHYARQLVTFSKLGKFDIPSEILARYASGNHPNIYAISRPSDEKGGFKVQIPIDEIRKLSEQMHYATTEGSWRVVIFDPIEALNVAASNALLKLLEEPPKKVVFFLISHAPNLLLPTIKSRCQILKFQPLSIVRMSEIWRNVTDEPCPSVEELSLAEGSMSAALRHDTGLAKLYNEALELLTMAPNIPHEAMLSFATKLNSGNRMETISRAKSIFGLLVGRILRAATSAEITRETNIATQIVTHQKQGKWADLGFEISKSLDDAQRLNLDPEIAIFHKWLAIEELIKS